MAFGLTIGTERSTLLQNSIQDELMKRGYSPDADPVMAEYITIMIINNKTPAQISSELEDLIGSDFDASFVDWLFAEAAKGAPDSDAPSTSAAPPPPTSPSTSAQPSARDSPPHLPNDSAARRPPSGPRASAPLYQQALSQALPSTSPGAQKRTASARSPSPTGHGHGHPHKMRRTDLPTGPRAMVHGREASAGPRSLLERVGPARNGHTNGSTGFPQDDIQARIDTITGGGAGSPELAAMMMNGFPGMNGMGGMGGIDMNAMSAMANPLLLQEMMMNQMALMTQMAGAMGIMGPGGQMMNGGFPMQQGMGDMFAAMNGMQQPQGMDAQGGRGRGRGRGGPAGRGAGRGRGGHVGGNAGTATINGAHASPPPAVSATAPAVIAPTPMPAVAPVIIATASGSSVASQARPGFVPPERPQSPTLCKFGLKCTNPVCRYSHPSPVATAESGVVLSNEACENGKNCKDKDCIKAHVSPAVLNPNAAEHLKPSTYTPPAAPVVHSHPHPHAHPQSQTPCRFGASCTRPNCTYAHPPRPSNTTSTTPCRFGAACTKATCPFQHPEGRVLPTTFHRGLSGSAPMVSVPTPETGSMGGQSQHRSMTFNKAGANTSAAELEKKVKEMEEKKNEAEKAVAQAEKAAAGAGKKDDASKPVAISA